MTTLLAQFNHENCTEGANCVKFHPIDFDNVQGLEGDNPTIVDIISRAIKNYIRMIHKDEPMRLARSCACVVWKDCGCGTNLVLAEEAEARTQIELMVARGYVDCILIGFQTRITGEPQMPDPRSDSSEASDLLAPNNGYLKVPVLVVPTTE